MAEIILEPLKKAIFQLNEGIKRSSKFTDDLLMRDGTIQRFEYTMDLCWKLIQRYLKDVAQVPETEIRSKKDLFREAAKIGYIENAEIWIGHYAL